MQSLVAVSDIELAKMENDIKKRALKLETDVGKKESQQWVIVMFNYLKDSGYKLPDADTEGMAKAYAGQLKDAITVYGYDNISICVKEWIKDDVYGRFPKAGQLLQKVHEMCGNPLAEVARRNHEAEVARIIENERNELMRKYTEDQIREIERRYKYE